MIFISWRNRWEIRMSARGGGHNPPQIHNYIGRVGTPPRTHPFHLILTIDFFLLFDAPFRPFLLATNNLFLPSIFVSFYKDLFVFFFFWLLEVNGYRAGDDPSNPSVSFNFGQWLIHPLFHFSCMAYNWIFDNLILLSFIPGPSFLSANIGNMHMALQQKLFFFSLFFCHLAVVVRGECLLCMKIWIQKLKRPKGN